MASSNDGKTQETKLPDNTPILDVVEEYELSVRARNVCLQSGAESFGDLIEIFRKHGGFLHLRNCGRKTNDELISVCMHKLDFSEEHAERQFLSLNEEWEDLLANPGEVENG